MTKTKVDKKKKFKQRSRLLKKIKDKCDKNRGCQEKIQQRYDKNQGYQEKKLILDIRKSRSLRKKKKLKIVIKIKFLRKN